MIEVEQLSKNFAGVSALSSLSFSIQPGEIVGFLGQNGAGKSTTLRILSGYLPPSSGRARVMNFDVETERDMARARIGYLPESVPLYHELRVSEYLRFRAKLKEVKRHKEEVDRVMQKTALTEHKSQIIGTLSKGFRQRVGLADALLQNPPILLLDEPTEGLDPTQINATRGLIQELSKEHTVLLSTHILPEVERLCSRVLLLHKGRLVADLSRTQDSWQRRGASQEQNATIHASFYEGEPQMDTPVKPGYDGEKSGNDGGVDALSASLKALPGIVSIHQKNNKDFSLMTSDPQKTNAALMALCIEKKLTLRELRVDAGSSLEELFLALTTKEQAA